MSLYYMHVTVLCSPATELLCSYIRTFNLPLLSLQLAKCELQLAFWTQLASFLASNSTTGSTQYFQPTYVLASNLNVFRLSRVVLCVSCSTTILSVTHEITHTYIVL